MIDLRPNPTRPLHALSKTRRPPTRPRGHRIACARGRIRAIPRRIQGTEEEESGGSRRRPKSVILRVHAPSPWPWRRPFVRAGGSVRQRQTAGKTPSAPSSQPSTEELRARSRTGTLKFRRNPWHWRDRTRPDGRRSTTTGAKAPWLVAGRGLVRDHRPIDCGPAGLFRAGTPHRLSRGHGFESAVTACPRHQETGAPSFGVSLRHGRRIRPWDSSRTKTNGLRCPPVQRCASCVE